MGQRKQRGQGIEPDPEAIVVNFGRFAWRSVIGMWLLCGLLAYGSWTVAADGEGLEALFGLVFLVVFGGLFLLFLIGAPAMVRKHGLLFDGKGVWVWDGPKKRTLLPWTDIAAAGVGYTRAPMSLLPLRQGEALELYPAWTEDSRGQEQLLSRWRVAEQPPQPHLPGERFRFALPAFAGLSKQVERAVRRYANHLWIGVYQRKWRRLPGK